MRHRPSVADVAKLAHVSVGTVSNVLNRPERVAPPTRERVRRAIEELDFVPSASARQLRAGVAQSVGAIVLDIANPFFTSVVRGIEDRLAEESLALLVSSSDDDVAREDHFLRQYEQHGVRGMILTPVSPDLTELVAIRNRGTPVVLMDAEGGDLFPSVSVDDKFGAHLAVSHLLSQGHRRITFYNGSHAIRQCQARTIGARQAIVDAGEDPDEILTEVTLRSLNADAGEAAMRTSLASPPSERPTAVFCVNDLVALGALRTALRERLSVPRDLAVVGYDDVAFASMLMVPLTTVRQPTHEIGWAAADLLLRMTGSEPPTDEDPEQVCFSPELVVRLSSDPTAVP